MDKIVSEILSGGSRWGTLQFGRPVPDWGLWGEISKLCSKSRPWDRKVNISNYLNIKKIFSERLIDVTSDFGTVQNAIGQLLGGSSDQFWVNAQRSGSLYRYQGDSERPTFHTTTDNNGDCLTFSSDSGNLESAVRISCGLLLSIVIHLRAKTVRL